MRTNKERIRKFIERLDDPRILEEFADKVILTDGCWLMLGGGKYPGFKDVQGHIASWLLFRDAIPPGKYILHKCDVQRCVNPEHLYLGTQSDNSKDAYARGQLRQEKALENDKLEMARIAYVEMNLTQKQVASLFKVGQASVGRALNGLKRGRYHKKEGTREVTRLSS